jgi:enamine deaminase RidA (YjgF/YER057c/UK114 family)
MRNSTEMKALSPDMFPPAKSLTLTENAPAPLGAYAHVVEAGPFLYLCGLGARDAETGEEAGLTRDLAGNVISYDITRIS